MPPRKTRPADRELLLRVFDLEARVRQLERRLRAVKGAQRTAAAQKAQAQAKKHKPRRRCPGCTLELPPGRRGVACVWCGFRFDAVPPWPPKRAAR